MEKKDLKKLTKGQLIKLLLKKEKKKPKVVIVDDTKPTRPKQQKKVSNHEDLLDNDPFKDEVTQRIKPTPPPRTGKWENVKPKPVPRKSVNKDIILPPPKGFRDRPPKPSRDPPLPPTPKHEFNFDDDIFQTENQNLEKFKIISVQSRENKKFKSYTNEFKVKILKKLDDVKEVYYISKN